MKTTNMAMVVIVLTAVLVVSLIIGCTWIVFPFTVGLFLVGLKQDFLA